MPSPTLFPGFALIATVLILSAAEPFTVATWNLENYLDQPTAQRPAKSSEAKSAVHAGLLELHADIIALQEMGSTNSLHELRDALKRGGVDYPHWEHVVARDDEIHLAVLSRFPISARRPHTNEAFLLDGRRFFVKRGFAEIDIRIGTNYQFTLLAAHLKSKRPVASAAEAALRLHEAHLLRRRVDTLLSENPNINLVVLGDFNDIDDSPPLKLILGHKDNRALFDTRPHEPLIPTYSSMAKNTTWTYHYAREKSFSRFDYILLSAGMKRECSLESARILARSDWRKASDHRPILARFTAEDR